MIISLICIGLIISIINPGFLPVFVLLILGYFLIKQKIKEYPNEEYIVKKKGFKGEYITPEKKRGK